jgi:hypothetical protein
MAERPGNDWVIAQLDRAGSQVSARVAISHHLCGFHGRLRSSAATGTLM